MQNSVRRTDVEFGLSWETYYLRIRQPRVSHLEWHKRPTFIIADLGPKLRE